MKFQNRIIAHLLSVAILVTALSSCSSGFDDDDDDKDNTTQTDDKTDDTDNSDKSCPYAFDNSSIQVYANALNMVHVKAAILPTVDELPDQSPEVTLLFSTSTDSNSFKEADYATSILAETNDNVDIYADKFGKQGTTYNARLRLTVGDTKCTSQVFRIQIPTLPEAQKKELKAVDLGLSVLWADRNLGAEADTSVGSYFSWGELTPKDTYTPENYAHNGIDLDMFINDCISARPNLDVALEAAGDGWRLPTYDEVRELYMSCSWAGQNIRGEIAGLRFSANGNSIILPCAGIRVEDRVVHNDEFTGFITGKVSGYYMTGTMGQENDVICSLIFTMMTNGKGEGISVSKNEDAWMGFSVRPVKDR